MNRRLVKILLTVCVTAVILFLIYSRIDLNAFLRTFAGMDMAIFWGGMALFIATTIISAYRYVLMLSETVKINLATSVKMYLAGNSLNIVLPSKMGDMSKAFFLKKEGMLGLSGGFTSVVAEKILDVSALAAVMLAGLMFAPKNSNFTIELKTILISAAAGLLVLPVVFYFINFKNIPLIRNIEFLKKVSEEVHGFVERMKSHKAKLSVVCVLSVLLWFTHVFQIYLFFRAFTSEVDLSLALGLIPAAIFIGLIPIAFAGIGTRDKALIILFGWYGFPAYLMAAVGIMCTVRYIVPALAGLPFLAGYMTKDKRELTV